MSMQHGLSARRTDVDANVVSIGRIMFLNILPHRSNQSPDSRLFLLSQAKEVGNVPAGHDEANARD